MSDPLIVSPDLEEWACTTVRDALAGRTEPYAAGVTVDIRVPNPIPDRLVVFNDDGGPRLNVGLERHRMRVRTWATTEKDAGDLARLVAGLLVSAASGKPVTHVAVQAPVDAQEDRPARLAWLELTAHTQTL